MVWQDNSEYLFKNEMTVEKITRIIWWRSITKTLFFLQLVITLLFLLQLSIRIFSSHKRNNCKCVSLCPLLFPVSLFRWSPLFEKPGMSFAECYLKGRLKNAEGEKDKSSTNVSFNFADIFRASREKIFISYGLIINNSQMYAQTHRMVCLWLPVVNFPRKRFG